MEDAAGKFPKDIAAMEQNLKRLEEQPASNDGRHTGYRTVA